MVANMSKKQIHLPKWILVYVGAELPSRIFYFSVAAEESVNDIAHHKEK